jgi:hypothetical protein
MGFRAMLLMVGIIAVASSFFVGYWIAWIGVTIMFFAIILRFIDKE